MSERVETVKIWKVVASCFLFVPGRLYRYIKYFHYRYQVIDRYTDTFYVSTVTWYWNWYHAGTRVPDAYQIPGTWYHQVPWYDLVLGTWYATKYDLWRGGRSVPGTRYKNTKEHLYRMMHSIPVYCFLIFMITHWDEHSEIKHMYTSS